MHRSLHMRCRQLVLVLLVLGIEAKHRLGVHYHRYLLSDYKPQHSPRVYWDYKRDTERGIKNSPEKGSSGNMMTRSGAKSIVLVRTVVDGSDKTSNLENFIVGVYHDDEFACSGTLVSERVAVTLSDCLNDLPEGKVTVHTHQGTKHTVLTNASSETFRFGGDATQLQVLTLKEPIVDESMKVELCKKVLKEGDHVIMPTYDNHQKEFNMLHTTIISPEDCRKQYEDPEGRAVSGATVCARNTRPSSGCQHSFGEPLVYDGRVCGVNIMGHNCPHVRDADVFLSMVSLESFIDTQVERMKNSVLDDLP